MEIKKDYFPYPKDYLRNYAIKNMWANPKLDQQYQVILNKISNESGEVNNFPFMGKWRLTPTTDDFYHIFNMSGIDTGFWDFSNKVGRQCPFERWLNAAELANFRGLQLDIYNSKGYQYPKGLTWIMRGYDGANLLAIKATSNYPVPLGSKMYFRCYTTDCDIDRSDEAVTSTVSFQYAYVEFINTSGLQALWAKYALWKTYPGLTTVFVNGVLRKEFPMPNKLQPGDLVEVNHDPTVDHIEYYNVADLQNFHSQLDNKRKFIVHPPKPADNNFAYQYFDDNDYYLVDENGTGLYYHRNSRDAVRQLTHRDVSISTDYVDWIKAQLPALAETDNLRLRVVYRQTKWDFTLGWEGNRIKYLYRMDDQGILDALTGVFSTLPEWTARGLETCYTNILLRSPYKFIHTELVANALSYNAGTKVLSDSPLTLTYDPPGRGIELPPSYRTQSTVWEYDGDGLLLGFYNISHQNYLTARYEDCALVELIMGEAGKELHSVVTKDPVNLSLYLSYRVYTCGWLIDTNEPDYKWVDITGTDGYTVTDGVLTWNVDLNNKTGMVLYNDKTIGYEFDLDHLDNSLSFAVTEIWEGGGIPLTLAPAQVDIWMNGHSLIENVDYTLEYPNIYIYNKQFIVEGAQHFAVRAYGICPMDEAPRNECELGYVMGGVIGVNGRYNVRDDRVTRIVIGGKLYLSSTVPNSELDPGDNLWDNLNGLPYMVKHVFCSNKYAKEYDNYYLYDESRELDVRVSNYLTAHCPKPIVSVIDDIVGDKYRLYSPFMNAVSNAILMGVITIDDLGSEYLKFTAQYIATKVQDYVWWLNYDPIKLGYDERYFSLQPHNDLGLLTMSAMQFKFLSQVNDIYFDGKLIMEGYYEVNNYGF